MRTSPQDWVQWDQNEVLPFEGGISFHVRTSTPCLVLNEFDLILGYNTGEQEIAVTGKGEVKFECKTDIWIKPNSRVQERLQASPEIFTTLDRPATLSPEMQAISRMMRKNEIERMRDRQEMEARFADRQRNDDRPEPKTDAQKEPAEAKKKVGADPSGGGSDPKEPSEPIKGEDAKTDGISGKKPTGNASSLPDST